MDAIITRYMISSSLNKTIPMQTEIAQAIKGAGAQGVRIRSRRALKAHIVRCAQRCGFSLFIHPVYGYDELMVRTRIKHARRYGNEPTTKYLVIPRAFVRNLYRIYRKWPDLGEFFLKTALLHEYKHLHQDIGIKKNLHEREHEANTFMIEESGWPGFIVSVWYYTLRRETGLLDRLFGKPPSLDKDEILKRTINCIEMIYYDIIPPELYDEIAEDVFRLECKFQRHRK
jgi:hypothetical protein